MAIPTIQSVTIKKYISSLNLNYIYIYIQKKRSYPKAPLLFFFLLSIVLSHTLYIIKTLFLLFLFGHAKWHLEPYPSMRKTIKKGTFIYVREREGLNL